MNRSIPIALVLFLVPFTIGAETAADSDKSEFGAEIVEKYVSSIGAQQESLRGLAMEVEINADLPKMHKSGKLSALRMISKVGRISYKVLTFSGDTTIKNEVIARFLTTEQTQSQKDNSSMAITPSNYKFKYKARLEQDNQAVYVFELKPKQKRDGLFKGELWIDAKTYLPVKENGNLVKTPSVFLKKVEFTREYEIVEGMAVPKHWETKADVRGFGRLDLNITYSTPKKLDEEQVPVEEARSHE